MVRDVHTSDLSVAAIVGANLAIVAKKTFLPSLTHAFSAYVSDRADISVTARPWYRLGRTTVHRIAIIDRTDFAVIAG